MLFVPIAAEFLGTEVIGEDQDDVGARGVGSFRGRRVGEERESDGGWEEQLGHGVLTPCPVQEFRLASVQTRAVRFPGGCHPELKIGI